jgi:hypothetical protein
MNAILSTWPRATRAIRCCRDASSSSGPSIGNTVAMGPGAVSAAREIHNLVFRQKSHKLIAGHHGTELFRSAHPVIGFCRGWVGSPIANVAVRQSTAVRPFLDRAVEIRMVAAVMKRCSGAIVAVKRTSGGLREATGADVRSWAALPQSRRSGCTSGKRYVHVSARRMGGARMGAVRSSISMTIIGVPPTARSGVWGCRPPR